MIKELHPKWKEGATAKQLPLRVIEPAEHEHDEDCMFYMMSEWLRGATMEADPS